MPSTVHPAWLPDAALSGLADRRAAVVGDGPCARSVVRELTRAGADVVARGEGGGPPELVLATRDHIGDGDVPAAVAELVDTLRGAAPLTPDGYVLARRRGTTAVVAGGDTGLLHGFFHLVRLGHAAFGAERAPERHEPVHELRMLDHWDNVDIHPVMGQVERGYSGGSIFYTDGRVREDLSRVEQYARLLAATGVNRVSVNNVNVHPREARLLTDDLDDVARIAAAFRPWGIRVHLSVSFASPVLLGGLGTADPYDPDVQRWWRETTERVYATIPDFGGYVVKADSEGQPGPFAYGRDHADGANLLAAALEPHGGVVHWRAFVYDHHQDWRDRTTDRARAAHDHFAPLDGRFAANVVLQVKHGPMDFQVREPVSPVIAALPRTRLAVELQVTQEYTGQQQHVCYLAPLWSEVLGFPLWGGDGPTVSDVAAGRGAGACPQVAAARGGGLAAVSNVGTDEFWTGHPLAQANLYAYGRLCWDPTLTPRDLLDEWVSLTFAGPDGAVDPRLRSGLHEILGESWQLYESYTAPLGVGFMVRPGHHYGPDVDGYEYTPWGTYHFADRDGVGVDRTRATGTGYTGQYPEPWREVYESLETCPDELLLFFHHVPYTHRLAAGKTVIQHIYDSRADGVERVEDLKARWEGLAGLVPRDVHARVTERIAEQLRSAREWRDQLRTYFYRKSGIPDATGRPVY